MNENINLVEILKDCPEGTPLYSVVHGSVIFKEIDNSTTNKYPIITAVEKNYHYQPSFNNMGKNNIFGEECLLFPSKEQRDWSKFKVNKHKFNPNILKPFDKVLVQEFDKWCVDLFSHFGDEESDYKYYCIGHFTDNLIPYNDDTKDLVGKDYNLEGIPEFYRYWED